MAFDSTGSDEGMIASINVTPLVDVMLVLLVIFMVTAPILQQGVELELPKETIAPLEGQGEQIVVSIDKEGKIYIGAKNEVKLEELAKRVQAISEARKDDSVFIKADKSVLYGSVMAVIGTLRQGGITKVGLVTEPK